MNDFRDGAWLRARQTVSAMSRWAARRRRMVAGQFLRGVSYGAGTAVTSLFVLWIQAHR
ncbi:hypothetical protein ACIQVO_36790 [Streptomyces sp. NPDC101062]|uniref:hypothetical protein n=1 Tax=unclassified Streptomyces TaxID=2593676 RepID=UPI002E75F1B7|nr:hypothetical protein [Streptomyces sp. JV176]MEE1801908.1 hypothetical protein [Streptomyces sp. JV176]